MTLNEKIEIMQWYRDGGEVEHRLRGDMTWIDTESDEFDFTRFVFRKKEKKQTIVLETWLLEVLHLNMGYYTYEATKEYFKDTPGKVKLISTREVEL